MYKVRARTKIPKCAEAEAWGWAGGLESYHSEKQGARPPQFESPSPCI